MKAGKFSILAVALLASLGSVGAADAQTTGLGGKVTVTAAQCEAGLHDVAAAVKRLHYAATSLIGELERQDMVAVAEPDVIGPIVIPAIPAPTGMLSMGTLPPRKKYVDIDMAYLAQIVPLLQTEVNSVPIPPEKQGEVSALMAELNGISSDIAAHYHNLIPLTKGPKYDTTAIGREILPIYDDTKKFEKPYKEVYRLIKEKS